MDAFWIMEHLDRQPQPSLSGFAEFVAWFATPVGKELLGIEGWDETGYAADGHGTLVRDAQHSTDGFWTADVEIIFFRIQNLVRYGPGLFIRLEIDQAGLHTPLLVIAKVSRKIRKSPSKDLFYLITMHRF